MWGLIIPLAVFTVVVAPAEAHWSDQAIADIVITDRETRMTLTFPTGLAAFADDDRNGVISPDELRAHRPEVERFFRERITMTGLLPDSRTSTVPDESSLPATLEVAPATGLPPTKGTAATHSTVVLIYRWPEDVRALTIRYGLFLPDVPTATCLATVIRGPDVRSVVFTPERREASFVVGRGWQIGQLTSFVALGVRHILSGYDHLLFLLSLLMAGGALLTLAKVVTAFTVAHSITLSLAVFGFVALPARWVESAVALSIAYVAIENLWQPQAAIRRRWFVTFGFGLVHGLGFASVLQELALPRAALAASLAGFNLGVELGQLGAVAVICTALRLLSSWSQAPALRRWVSIGTASAGLVWFVQRAFFGA